MPSAPASWQVVIDASWQVVIDARDET